MYPLTDNDQAEALDLIEQRARAHWTTQHGYKASQTFLALEMCEESLPKTTCTTGAPPMLRSISIKNGTKVTESVLTASRAATFPQAASVCLLPNGLKRCADSNLQRTIELGNHQWTTGGHR
jgi:hypothetical protein